MLHVAFKENTFRKDGGITSKIVARSNTSYEEVISYMSKGAVGSQTDMKATMDHFAEAMVHFLAKGYQVQTPLGTFSLGLRGTGERKITIDNLFLRVRPTATVLQDLKTNLQVSVVDTPALLTPVIISLSNAERKGLGETGAAGEMFHITGSRLSLDDNDPVQGVFLVAQDGSEFRSSLYTRIGSNFIDCKIPNVVPGNYTLEVRNQPGKTLRFGVYNNPLVIA